MFAANLTGRTIRAPLAAALVLSGCSWTTMTVLPEPLPSNVPPECTESRAAPIADLALAMAGVGGLVGGFVLTTQERGDLTGLVQGTGVLLALSALGVSVPFGLSAIYGMSEASRCEDARHQGPTNHTVPAGLEISPFRPSESKPCRTEGPYLVCDGPYRCVEGRCVPR